MPTSTITAALGRLMLLPEPHHVPEYSHAHQVAGAAVVIGLIVMTIMASIVWNRRGR
jgi:hypothetical protein